MRSVPILASADGAARLTQDQEDDADDQHDNADRPQNADAQDPAQDQQDETKNNHVILLVLFYPGIHCLTQQVADASLAAEPAAIDTTSEPGDRKAAGGRSQPAGRHKRSGPTSHLPFSMWGEMRSGASTGKNGASTKRAASVPP